MEMMFYVGGYKKDNNECLYLCKYTNDNLQIIESYDVGNASYLCMSEDRKNIYAVVETDSFMMKSGGGVAAFHVQPDGRLKFLNTAHTDGEHPCHISVCTQNRKLYAANYSGGSTVIFDLKNDGSIGLKKRLIDHNVFGKPSGAVVSRQKNPYAHYIQCRNAETVWVCDLGLDLVLVLDTDGNEIARLSVPCGFGPRHTAFHPVLPVAYVVGEMGQAVLQVNYSDLKMEAGSPVPVSPNATVSCAAVRVSPDGKFLLTSNRADISSLSVLKLNDKGEITGVSSVFITEGKCPRDFIFTPKGDKLFAAYQDSDYIEVVDWRGDGKLTPTGLKMSVPKPACILF